MKLIWRIDLVKTHHSSKLEKGRRLFCPQISMLFPHKSVADYLLYKCRRLDLLLSADQEDDTIHEREWIYQHFYPEGWALNILRVPKTLVSSAN